MNKILPKPELINTGETYGEKAARRFRENPFVPIGALLTTGALITAMVKMRRGESRSFNNWLRVRVIAQGVTIIAIVAGTYSLGSKDSKETQLENELRARDEKVGKERAAFEERIKEAEETYNLENPGKNVREAKTVSAKEVSVPATATPPTSPAVSRIRTSWWGWGGNKSKDSTPESSTPVDSDKKS